MSSTGNNIDKEYADLRDAFLTPGEEAYLEKLMQDPNERHIHSRLLRKRASELYNTAKSLIDKVENGEFNDRQMQRVEYVILHCLKAIDDLELANEKEPSLIFNDDELEM